MENPEPKVTRIMRAAAIETFLKQASRYSDIRALSIDWDEFAEEVLVPVYLAMLGFEHKEDLAIITEVDGHSSKVRGQSTYRLELLEVGGPAVFVFQGHRSPDQLRSRINSSAYAYGVRHSNRFSVKAGYHPKLGLPGFFIRRTA